MRQIINISVPEAMAQNIKKEVQKGGYASTSEFIRYLIRLWKTKQLAENQRVSKKQRPTKKVGITADHT